MCNTQLNVITAFGLFKGREIRLYQKKSFRQFLIILISIIYASDFGVFTHVLRYQESNESIPKALGP